MLGNRSFLSRNSTVENVDIAKKKNNIELARRRLLQKVKDRDEINMS